MIEFDAFGPLQGRTAGKRQGRRGSLEAPRCGPVREDTPLANIKSFLPNELVTPPKASFSTGGPTPVAAPSPTAPIQFPEMQWSDIPVEDRILPEDDPDCFPGSYKWLQMTTGVKWPDTAHPAQVNETDGWLRAHNGVWQRQVVLQNLSSAPQYNGCVGWVDHSHLESAAGQTPRLLVVQLTEPARTVQVSSAHVFAVGPLFRQKQPRSSLFTVSLKLHTPRGPVPVTALVDTGCELQGLVNKRFAATWDLPLSPASQSVRTATGEVVSGMQQAAVQTHFAPGFSRRVEYGVLDIPGFDVILGVGFLQQCAPYQLQDDGQGQRSVRLTVPSSRRVMVLEAAPLGQLTVPQSPLLAANVHAAQTAHGPMEMHWSTPTVEEYANVVAAFSIILDPQTAQPLLSPNGSITTSLCTATGSPKWQPVSGRKVWCSCWGLSWPRTFNMYRTTCAPSWRPC